MSSSPVLHISMEVLSHPCNAGMLLPWRPLRSFVFSGANYSIKHTIKRPKFCRRLANSAANYLQEQKSNDLQDLAFIVVPGWLSDSSQYEPMASYMRTKGLTTLIVPLKWYNWIPSLGGRSVRPILDRIDATIALVLNQNSVQPSIEGGQSVELTDSGDENPGEFSNHYTFWDFAKEFLNPRNGAQEQLYPLRMVKEASFPKKTPKKVILIAHSAGGWICRILLGRKVPYYGRIYSASRSVKALVTLGTPHLCTDKLTKRNMEFVNENYPGTAEAEQGVQYLCIAGKFVQGEAQLAGLWKDFAWQSYELCCGKGDVWGDGVIPLECALGLEGAQHIILQGVEHFPSVGEKELRSWYGSPAVVDMWLPSLLSLALTDGKEGANLNSDETAACMNNTGIC